VSASPGQSDGGLVVDPVVELPLSQLKLWDDDPRWIRPERLGDLMAAMTAEREMLRLKPLWALPDGTVFAGNQRLAAARALGWESIPVVVVHGATPAQVKTWALLDNNQFGDWNEPALAEFLSGLLADGVDAVLTGFEARELDTILASLAPVRDPDEIPPPPPTPESRPGELYELGTHRLLCDDSTDPTALARLVGRERIAALVTDFPWGVDYVGKTSEGLRIANDDPAQLPDFLSASFAALDSVLRPNTPFYLFVPSGPAGTEFLVDLRAVGWRHRQSLVWAKDSFVLGHGDYHNRHESILYGFTPGSGRIGRGTAAAGTAATIKVRCCFFDRPKRSREHPTSKPAQLLAALIRNSTRQGELVLDPFAGSGSTLLACELLGRRCAAVELEPRYADVIRRRYEEYVGG
jgi:site-specific DNA-methyltransferase (adenine-specific)